MFLLYLRIFVIITKNQKRRSQLTSHMSLSEPKKRSDQLKCLTEEDHLANGVLYTGQPGSFDRFAGNQVPKINLEQKLTLKRSFYGKIAFLTRTLSSKSYTLKQQQTQQQNKFASQLNAFQRESEASGKENELISKTAANHHYESVGHALIERGGLANNESQLAGEPTHRNLLIKKANTKLTGNRLIRSCGTEDGEQDGRHIEPYGENEANLKECSRLREDAANNNLSTHLCSSCDRNVTNNRNNTNYSNGSTGSKSSQTKCPTNGNQIDNKARQTSLIKDEKQSERSDKPDNQLADRREQQRQSGRHSDVLRSILAPDEQNGTQLGASRRPLLNKFRCDNCFGLSGKAADGKALHSSLQSNSLESTNLERNLNSHQYCEHNSDCKDDCKLIKSADNHPVDNHSRGKSNGQSNGRPVCLSGRRPNSETNLAEQDHSSPNRPKSAEQCTGRSPSIHRTSSNHQFNHTNHANLSSNSSNLLSNKLTNWPNDQAAEAPQSSLEKLNVELVKKNATCSPKSFRSIKSVEIRDDQSADLRRPADGLPAESPSKLTTGRSHFNYPRKLRNKLNASIHGSRSVRFHTKALFTTLTILGTYLVCIMPALSAYFSSTILFLLIIILRILWHYNQ